MQQVIFKDTSEYQLNAKIFRTLLTPMSKEDTARLFNLTPDMVIRRFDSIQVELLKNRYLPELDRTYHNLTSIRSQKKRWLDALDSWVRGMWRSPSDTEAVYTEIQKNLDAYIHQLYLIWLTMNTAECSFEYSNMERREITLQKKDVKTLRDLLVELKARLVKGEFDPEQPIKGNIAEGMNAYIVHEQLILKKEGKLEVDWDSETFFKSVRDNVKSFIGVLPLK